jgi:hypothetical protein
VTSAQELSPDESPQHAMIVPGCREGTSGWTATPLIRSLKSPGESSRAISSNAHGNVSLRVAGEDEMYFTGGSSLRDHPAEAAVRVGLDGVLRDGVLPPIQGTVVAMHGHVRRAV